MTVPENSAPLDDLDRPARFPRAKRGFVAQGECRQSRSCYVMGCDNDCCRALQTRYVKANRTLKMQLGLINHGPVGYDCGCRCDECLPSRVARYKAETLRKLKSVS